jgi:hypothetical protein
MLSDVGLLEILLCAARTPALQKLFRTHLRTAPCILIIAPALAPFSKNKCYFTVFTALSKFSFGFFVQ